MKPSRAYSPQEIEIRVDEISRLGIELGVQHKGKVRIVLEGYRELLM